jgi:hypothetical protein
MTEKTEQLPKINYKDKDYNQEDLTDQQKYLFNQVIDITKKENQIKFNLDQILAMKQVFEERLDKELEQ